MSSLLDNEEDEEVDNLQFTDEPGRRRRSSKKLKDENKKFNFYDDMDELGVEKSFIVRKNLNYI